MVHDDEEAEREALRRRLYSSGASDADRARYRALAGEGAPPAVERGPAGRRRIRTPLVAFALLAAVLVGAGLGIRGLGTARPGPAMPAPTAVAMTAADRGELEDGLGGGGAAGIAAYLVTHRSPPALRSATRFDTVERWGAGSASVTLSPVVAQAVAGRATVLLVLASDGQADWTAFRREVDSTGEQRTVRQTGRGGEQPAGVLTAATFRYAAGDRPVTLRVRAQGGVRWGVAVVFSD